MKHSKVNKLSASGYVYIEHLLGEVFTYTGNHR